MRSATFILLLVSASDVFGQNLLPNASFEIKKPGCIPSSTVTSYECIHQWKRINNGTPDFLDERDFPPDRKALGYFAVEGNAFAGLSMVNGILEYIAMPLDQPLEKGAQYVFEAYIKFARDRTNHRDVQLGVWAATSDKSFEGKTPKASLKLDTVRLYSYKPIRLSFVAKGYEKMLIIGPVDQGPVTLAMIRYVESYLLIDRVSLQKINVVPKNKQEHFRFLFETNAYDVNKKELSGFLAQCAGKKVVLVNVEGFTDVQGDEASNFELSASRCNAISDALVKGLGMDKRSIHLYPKGESLASGSNDTRQMQLDRKVEVTVFYE